MDAAKTGALIAIHNKVSRWNRTQRDILYAAPLQFFLLKSGVALQKSKEQI